MRIPGPTFPAGRPFLHLDRKAFDNDFELLDSGVIGASRPAITSDLRPVCGRFWLLLETGPLVLK